MALPGKGKDGGEAPLTTTFWVEDAHPDSVRRGRRNEDPGVLHEHFGPRACCWVENVRLGAPENELVPPANDPERWIPWGELGKIEMPHRISMGIDDPHLAVTGQEETRLAGDRSRRRRGGARRLRPMTTKREPQSRDQPPREQERERRRTDPPVPLPAADAPQGRLESARGRLQALQLSTNGVSQIIQRCLHRRGVGPGERLGHGGCGFVRKRERSGGRVLLPRRSSRASRRA